jgi:hypothetical protein
MSIVKKSNNWGYSADRSTDNWTGRVSRQERITGEWSRYVRANKRIPPIAYLGAAAFVAVIFVLAFVGSAAGF